MLEQFKELGYVYQLPKGRDKTLYLVKQDKDYTKQIFIEYNKKEAKIYVYKIKDAIKQNGLLMPKEIEAILSFLVDNGIGEYEIVKEEE